jgi:hypothetical protein
MIYGFPFFYSFPSSSCLGCKKESMDRFERPISSKRPTADRLAVGQDPI